MKVADIMRRQVLTVSPETSLKEAGRLIFGNRVSALPVVDKKNKLLGIIVEKDILSLLYPSYQEYIEDYIEARDFEVMEKRAAEVMEKKAREVMKKTPVVVFEHFPVLRAASLMLVKRVSILPVVDESYELKGIISHGDVFRYIAQKTLPRFREAPTLFDRLGKNYDLLVDWEQRLKEEIPFLAKKLKEIKAETVLDIGSGTGEHALAKAKLGFKVTGIDTSREMIRIAREKQEQLKPEERKRLEFIVAGLGEVQKKIRRTFDAVFCLGNTLPFSSDLTFDLADIFASLKPGGLFLAQFLNFDRIIKTASRDIKIDFRLEEEEGEKREYGFLRFYDLRNDGDLDFNIITLVKSKKGWRSYGAESTIHKAIGSSLINNLLKKTGFKKIQFQGSLSQEKYQPDKSHDLVILAYK